MSAPSSTAPPRVGFIGLGSMGAPMAGNVATAGFPLTVWNRTAAKATAVADVTGAAVAATPAELVAGSDVVVTMVADGPALLDCYSDGLVAALRPGTLCIDMSTVAPEDSRRVAAITAEADAAFVDAPVSGSVALAEAGTLTIMAGGSARHVARAQAVLEAMGSRIFHMGPVGTGVTIKLAVNSIVYGLSQALSEALVLAERCGIERGTAYEVFANSAIAAPFVAYRQEAFLHPGAIPAAFRMELAGKDLDLAISLAESVDAALPQAELNRTVIAEAIAAGFGEDDMSAVAQHLRTTPHSRTTAPTDGADG